MTPLDPDKLLAHDPATTRAFLAFARRCIRRYLQDPSRVREASQSALAEMLAKLQRGDIPEPARVIHWVATSAGNAARRELTRLRRRALAYESRLHTKPAPDQDEVFALRQELDRIDGLLAQLGERSQRAVIAAALGQSAEEIAADLGTSPGAVRSLIYRSRRQLRDELSAEERLERMVLVAKLAAHQRRLGPTRSGSSRR
jgi:RNA polymerase sigma factor (sigma-70 family)